MVVVSVMSRPPTPGGGADRSDLNGTLHHGSTIKFFKFSRNGTPAVTLDRNADLGALGDDYEEVDYNVEDILAVSCAPEIQLFLSKHLNTTDGSSSSCPPLEYDYV